MKSTPLNIVKYFNPSWFSAVMGTGILSIGSYYYSSYLPILKTFSLLFYHLAFFLLFLLLIPWTLRWLFFFKNAYGDLENPILSSFYSTLPVGVLILSIGSIIIVKNYLLGKILWFIGTPLIIFFVLISFFLVFTGEKMTLDHVSPAWFIPLTGLLSISVAGSILLEYETLYLRKLILLLNYFGWGSGFLLYLALFAICMYRFMLHPPLPGILSPTIWINLGPVGTGVTGIINLVIASKFITVKEPFFIFAFLFWSFGLWWVIMALSMTIYYFRKVKVPYGVSWWGYTFPLGAYVTASYSVGNVIHFDLVQDIGFLLYWLLVFFWATTFTNTILAILRGTLLESAINE